MYVSTNRLRALGQNRVLLILTFVVPSSVLAQSWFSVNVSQTGMLFP